MYYIDRPATWSSANRKCELLQDFVNQFRNTLIADDISRDALVEDIRHKVEELNQAFPRTKPITVTDRDNYIACFHKTRTSGDEYVFTIRTEPVRRTFRFSEKAAASLLKEGGEE